MSVYELWKSGELQPLIERGIIKSSIIYYCNVFQVYQSFRDEGLNYTEAVYQTSIKIPTSVETVKRAISAVI